MLAATFNSGELVHNSSGIEGACGASAIDLRGNYEIFPRHARTLKDPWSGVINQGSSHDDVAHCNERRASDMTFIDRDDHVTRLTKSNGRVLNNKLRTPNQCG